MVRKNEKKWKWIENKQGKVTLEVHEHCQSKGNHHNAKNEKHVNKIESKKQLLSLNNIEGKHKTILKKTSTKKICNQVKAKTKT